MTSKASKTTEIDGVRIQCQQTNPFCFEVNQANASPQHAKVLVGPYNFYLDHEVILVRPFRIWAIYVFTLEEVFFLFFQPSPRFLRSFEPVASSVFIISHCVPLLNVSKLIGITVFDEKTVFRSFFDLLKRFCGQIVFHIKQKPPL